MRTVARLAPLSDWSTGQPDGLRAIITGHSGGGYLAAGIALGVNPWRPGIPAGGNRLDPADPNSPPVAIGVIPMAPSVDFLFADRAAPLIPMISHQVARPTRSSAPSSRSPHATAKCSQHAAFGSVTA